MYLQNLRQLVSGLFLEFRPRRNVLEAGLLADGRQQLLRVPSFRNQAFHRRHGCAPHLCTMCGTPQACLQPGHNPAESSNTSNHADCQCRVSTSLLAQRRRPPRRAGAAAGEAAANPPKNAA